MPIANYGVLKGKAVATRLATRDNAHYQVHIVDSLHDYRIAVNVLSAVAPSEVAYIVVEGFAHPVLDRVLHLPSGFSPLASRPDSGALDFIRGNLFDRNLMVPLPFNVPGADNDLNEKLDNVMQRAVADETAIVYAFGQRWGPEPTTKDKVFGFLPGNGIHDIHMNQGNVGQFVKDDGPWQDGGLLVNMPGRGTWTAIFLKFQSQSWHTDDRTGHALSGVPVPPTGPGTPPPMPTPTDPQGLVRIVAALVNPFNPGTSVEHETVTLVNRSAAPVSLNGWALLDNNKARSPVTGTLAAGAAQVFAVTPPAALTNKGGIITLVNDHGLKVDGVSYTKEQASEEGWTIVF